MPSNLQIWINTLPINNPLQRRQAGLFQYVLFIIIGAALIGAPVSLLTIDNITNSIPPGISYLVLFVIAFASLTLLRRGYFIPSVMLMTCSIVVVLGILMLSRGVLQNGTGMLVFAIPIVMAGLLIGRRALWLFVAMSIGFVVAATLIQHFTILENGESLINTMTAFATIANFTLIIVVIGGLLELFGSSLRSSLAHAQSREQELQELHALLEATVAERTASLAEAIEASSEREERLERALMDLGASQETIRELSAPVLPVLPGVLVAPLIGVVDTQRAAVLTDNVLRMVEQERAKHVIIDITGVSVVDSHVAQVLLRATQAVRMLGARVLLVGIRPEVAQTLVSLDVDLSTIRTYSSLREAVVALQ